MYIRLTFYKNKNNHSPTWTYFTLVSGWHFRSGPVEQWPRKDCFDHLHMYVYVYVTGVVYYIILYYIILYYIILYYIILYYIILYYIILYYITLHYITLHYITLHYITLHYITLHYMFKKITTLHYITLYIALHVILYYTTYSLFLCNLTIFILSIDVYIKHIQWRDGITFSTNCAFTTRYVHIYKNWIYMRVTYNIIVLLRSANEAVCVWPIDHTRVSHSVSYRLVSAKWTHGNYATSVSHHFT